MVLEKVLLQVFYVPPAGGDIQLATLLPSWYAVRANILVCRPDSADDEREQHARRTNGLCLFAIVQTKADARLSASSTRVG